jgi:hypothetical protein
MDLSKLVQESEFTWKVAPSGKMRVPGILYGSKNLVEQMDEKVYEQLSNVAALPASSAPPTPCRMRIGDTAFLLEALLRSMRSKGASYRPAASGLISRAGYGR